VNAADWRSGQPPVLPSPPAEALAPLGLATPEAPSAVEPMPLSAVDVELTAKELVLSASLSASVSAAAISAMSSMSASISASGSASLSASASASASASVSSAAVSALESASASASASASTSAAIMLASLSASASASASIAASVLKSAINAAESALASSVASAALSSVTTSPSLEISSSPPLTTPISVIDVNASGADTIADGSSHAAASRASSTVNDTIGDALMAPLPDAPSSLPPVTLPLVSSNESKLNSFSSLQSAGSALNDTLSAAAGHAAAVESDSSRISRDAPIDPTVSARAHRFRGMPGMSPTPSESDDDESPMIAPSPVAEMAFNSRGEGLTTLQNQHVNSSQSLNYSSSSPVLAENSTANGINSSRTSSAENSSASSALNGSLTTNPSDVESLSMNPPNSSSHSPIATAAPVSAAVVSAAGEDAEAFPASRMLGAEVFVPEFQGSLNDEVSCGAMSAARASLNKLRVLLLSNLRDPESDDAEVCVADGADSLAAEAPFGAPGCPAISSPVARKWLDMSEALLSGVPVDDFERRGDSGQCACPSFTEQVLPASLAAALLHFESEFGVVDSFSPALAVFREQREAIVDLLAASAAPHIDFEQAALLVDGVVGIATASFVLALAALLGDLVTMLCCCVPCRGSGKSSAAAAKSKNRPGVQVGGSSDTEKRPLFPSPTPHPGSLQTSPEPHGSSPGNFSHGGMMPERRGGFPVGGGGRADFRSPPPPAHLAAALARIGVLDSNVAQSAAMGGGGNESSSTLQRPVFSSPVANDMREEGGAPMAAFGVVAPSLARPPASATRAPNAASIAARSAADKAATAAAAAAGSQRASPSPWGQQQQPAPAIVTAWAGATEVRSAGATGGAAPFSTPANGGGGAAPWESEARPQLTSSGQHSPPSPNRDNEASTGFSSAGQLSSGDYASGATPSGGQVVESEGKLFEWSGEQWKPI
jgi:hypothetical protein